MCVMSSTADFFSFLFIAISALQRTSNTSFPLLVTILFGADSPRRLENCNPPVESEM